MNRISKPWFAGYFIFLFFCQLSSAQTPKGVIPTSEGKTETGRTRALVVGISQYQFIDKLQFADRDAEVFAQYLLNSHFWGIEKDDVTLLLNDKARNGDIITQLARLAQVTRPGDNLIFYFSGHGDVETITQFNNGYLLASDTYSNNYIAGALPVSFIKELFLTLTNKNIKVMLITDACRSGKLAGGMKGSEYVATAISNMWNNEIKILSTQPGHLSYEDKKWGDGRGVFSLYLVKGLSGEADANKDSSITLNELQQYVGSNVARETRNDQQPIVEGPNPYSTVIARISPSQPGQGSGRNTGNHYNSKFRWPLDSCTYYFQEMRKAVKDQRFDLKEPINAAHYYKKMKSCGADQGLLLLANSELLAGLMNASQEIINNSFVGKTLVTDEEFKKGVSLIDQLLANNDLHLPNTIHLLNLKRYLSVMGPATWNDYADVEKLGPILDTALKIEPDAAYLLTAKGALEMRKKNWKQAMIYLQSALQKSPGWLMPKYMMGNCLAERKHYREALSYYEDVLLRDSTYHTFECAKCILGRMADFALKTKQIEKARQYWFKCIEIFPDYGPPYESLYDHLQERPDSVMTNKLLARLKLYDTVIFHRCMIFRIQTQLQNKSLPVEELGSLLSLAKDKTDSAYFYYTAGEHYASKKYAEEDSAYYYYQKAVDTDTADAQYVIIFAEYLHEIDDASALQELLENKYPNFKGEERAAMQSYLAYSYLESDEPEKAFNLLKEVVEAGYISCAELREFRKVFKSYKPFEDYIKDCKDKVVQED